MSVLRSVKPVRRWQNVAVRWPTRGGESNAGDQDFWFEMSAAAITLAGAGKTNVFAVLVFILTHVDQRETTEFRHLAPIEIFLFWRRRNRLGRMKFIGPPRTFNPSKLLLHVISKRLTRICSLTL